MSLEEGRGDRDRMRRALGQAVVRFGGVRNISGISLVALLCASAFAPLAASWSAGALASVVGNAGAEVLAGVVTQALDALRGRNRGRPATGEEIERAVARGLEAALAEVGEHGTAVREATCELLRELGATRAVVEQASEVGEQTRADVVSCLTRLARLSAQFDEFAPLSEEIYQATWRIEEMVREHLVEARAADERLREHGMMLAQIRDLLERGERATSIAASAWPECPYLGLAPFTAREERIFFGREVPVDQLREKLKDWLDGGGVLLVTGASGAGKSSLLRAGLVPRLSREGVFAYGSARWPCRVLTPHNAPLRELAAGLAGLVPDTGFREVFDVLSRDPGQAARFASDAARAAGGPGARLILIVDQFEELFTLAAQDPRGHAERGKFVDALHAMAEQPVEPGGRPPALVVVAVRGDFLDRALAYPPLADAHDKGPFAVRPITERELRDAVTGPAGEAGVGIDDDLVEEIVREARAQAGSPTVEAGALPLVSQALRATWEKCDGQRLTLSAYRRVGGLANAVDRDATAALKSLDGPLR